MQVHLFALPASGEGRQLSHYICSLVAFVRCSFKARLCAAVRGGGRAPYALLLLASCLSVALGRAVANQALELRNRVLHAGPLLGQVAPAVADEAAQRKGAHEVVLGHRQARPRIHDREHEGRHAQALQAHMRPHTTRTGQHVSEHDGGRRLLALCSGTYLRAHGQGQGPGVRFKQAPRALARAPATAAVITKAIIPLANNAVSQAARDAPRRQRARSELT